MRGNCWEDPVTQQEECGAQMSPVAAGWSKLAEVRRWIDYFRSSGKWTVAYMSQVTDPPSLGLAPGDCFLFGKTPLLSDYQNSIAPSRATHHAIPGSLASQS